MHGTTENFTEILTGKKIREIRLARGLTQKTFAQSLGIVQGFLSGIESGKKEPSPTLLYAICHKYNVPEDWLVGDNTDTNTPPASNRPVQGENGAGIPLLERIPSGFPESLRKEDVVSYISLPGVPEGCYALTAEGDFMAPTVRSGDLVIFRTGEEPTNKSIVLVNNRWGEVILRRYRIRGDETFFSSDNAIYAPFTPNASTRVFGTVVAIWRKVPN
ncbi:MAG TPA: XRE family transcriptional regulator [Geobacteraceae bacterium]